jgi:hypothetical protein
MFWPDFAKNLGPGDLRDDFTAISNKTAGRDGESPTCLAGQEHTLVPML